MGRKLLGGRGSRYPCDRRVLKIRRRAQPLAHDYAKAVATPFWQGLWPNFHLWRETVQEIVRCRHDAEVSCTLAPLIPKKRGRRPRARTEGHDNRATLRGIAPRDGLRGSCDNPVQSRADLPRECFRLVMRDGPHIQLHFSEMDQGPSNSGSSTAQEQPLDQGLWKVCVAHALLHD